MFNSLSTPVLIAHRGASAHAPENTLASFHLAAKQGARMIELDVQLTADKKLVVIHDSRVDRTTNGSGKISSLSLAEIKTLNISSEFQNQYQTDRVPTLEEVFSQLDENIYLNIELKNLFHPLDELPRRVVELVQRHQMQARVFFSSFNPWALAHAAKLLPACPRGRLLHYPLTVDLHSRFPFLLHGFKSVNISFRSLSEQRVKTFQNAGLKVFTYTVNAAEDIIKSLNLGVDGFFTDDPPAGFAAIDRWKKNKIQSKANRY